MKVLDLFCKAGGAAMGIKQAWPNAEIVGIDIDPQPNYPFSFVRADVRQLLTWKGGHFAIREHVDRGPYLWEYRADFVWASPPCQSHCSMKVMHNARVHEDLIPEVRSLVKTAGVPYVIENVVGAPLENPVRLCGSSFGLGIDWNGERRQLRRHRLFESSYPIKAIACQHVGATIGIYGDHARDRRRKPGIRDRGLDFPDANKIALGREAMGIDWMNWKELSQAIPPAYSRYIAQSFSPSAG